MESSLHKISAHLLPDFAVSGVTHTVIIDIPFVTVFGHDDAARPY
jgi:hypothetical protein